MQVQRDGYIISTDRARLDLDVIHDFLANQSYWAEGRSRARVQKAVENSLCFGIYTEAGEHVGLARVLKHLLLATRDAHTLYQKYGGFEIMEDMGRYLHRDTL